MFHRGAIAPSSPPLAPPLPKGDSQNTAVHVLVRVSQALDKKFSRAWDLFYENRHSEFFKEGAAFEHCFTDS